MASCNDLFLFYFILFLPQFITDKPGMGNGLRGKMGMATFDCPHDDWSRCPGQIFSFDLQAFIGETEPQAGVEEAMGEMSDVHDS